MWAHALATAFRKLKIQVTHPDQDTAVEDLKYNEERIRYAPRTFKDVQFESDFTALDALPVHLAPFVPSPYLRPER